MTNARWWITDAIDNDVKDRYKNLSNLLKKPNPLETWNELIIKLHTYLQLYGEVFLYANTPEGFSANKDANSLWVINPTYINIELTGKLYQQSKANDIIQKYYLNINGKREELGYNNVLHIRDSFQNLNFNPTDIRGISRIIGLEYPIKNIIQAYEAIYSLNKDRGPQGILSNISKDAIGSVPIDPKEKQDLQDAYQGYGLSKHQKRVLITGSPLQWQSMSYSVKELMLFEGVKSNIEQLS